jgi:hypothetical protein
MSCSTYYDLETSCIDDDVQRDDFPIRQPDAVLQDGIYFIPDKVDVGTFEAAEIARINDDPFASWS